MSKKKKSLLTVTVDSVLKDKLKSEAEKEGRTLSNYVNWLLSNLTKK
jgi:hypothetical protein